MPFGFHPIYLLVLLVVVLIIFGPGKLPELGSAVGRAMRQFREATSDIKDEVSRAVETPAQPAPEASAAPTTTTATAAAPSTEPAPARTRRASKARTDSNKA
jgi:TatA/E family protein of Tat protein translocase